MVEGLMCRRKADCAGMVSDQRQHFTWHRARTGVAFMIITGDPAVYLERAEMHEKLAAETADLPARKMHLAMAAEYRRQAAEISAVSITDRQSVVKGKSVSVRVDLGGRRIIKKKTKKYQ